MWYPSKLQWFLIWMTTFICLVLWLTTDPAPAAFILPAGLVAVLFCWQVSQDLVGRGSRD